MGLHWDILPHGRYFFLFYLFYLSECHSIPYWNECAAIGLHGCRSFEYTIASDMAGRLGTEEEISGISL